MVAAVDARLRLKRNERDYVEALARRRDMGHQPGDFSGDVQELRELVEVARDAGLASGIEGLNKADGRWELLRELEEAARPDVPWAPSWLRVRYPPMALWTNRPLPAAATRIEIDVDGRVPLRLLVAYLTPLWPALRNAGAVRRTRPLGDRKVALVRFVCLEMAAASWRERFDAWNARHRKWAYKQPQGFQKDFHDGEQALTGQPHGLAWFYDAKARLPDVELEAIARQGDPAAQRESARRWAVRNAMAKQLGVEVKETSATTRTKSTRRTTL